MTPHLIDSKHCTLCFCLIYKSSILSPLSLISFSGTTGILEHVKLKHQGRSVSQTFTQETCLVRLVCMPGSSGLRVVVYDVSKNTMETQNKASGSFCLTCAFFILVAVWPAQLWPRRCFVLQLAPECPCRVKHRSTAKSCWTQMLQQLNTGLSFSVAVAKYDASKRFVFWLPIFLHAHTRHAI